MSPTHARQIAQAHQIAHARRKREKKTDEFLESALLKIISVSKILAPVQRNIIDEQNVHVASVVLYEFRVISKGQNIDKIISHLKVIKYSIEMKMFALI